MSKKMQRYAAKQVLKQAKLKKCSVFEDLKSKESETSKKLSLAIYKMFSIPKEELTSAENVYNDARRERQIHEQTCKDCYPDRISIS